MEISRLSNSLPVTKIASTKEGKLEGTQIQENQTLLQQEELQQQELVNKRQPDQQKLNEVVEGLNDFLLPSHTAIKFELHEKLDEYFVKIIDKRTKEVVREIPPEKMLDMYAAMKEFLGLIVDKKI